MEAGGSEASGWRQVAGGWRQVAPPPCQVAGARWLEWWLEVVAGGWWQENGGVAGVAGGLVWLVWWVFGMAYRYRTETPQYWQYIYR